jgi:iron complex outermembrane receptor protein
MRSRYSVLACGAAVVALATAAPACAQERIFDIPGPVRGARHSRTGPPGPGADRGLGAQSRRRHDARGQRPDGRPRGASPADRRHAPADRLRRRPDHHAAIVRSRASSNAAQAVGSGVVRGRVLNTATGEYVRNAEIRVEGTTIVAYSEDGGDFRLSACRPATRRRGQIYRPAGGGRRHVSAGQMATLDFALSPLSYAGR